jgi:aminoglycoside phosphotransferase (APT) family kinase protein
MIHGGEAEALHAAIRCDGWSEGFGRFLDTLPATRVAQFRHEIRMHHTAWRGLLAPAPRRIAVVFDNGLGSVPLALAGEFEEVHAHYEERSLFECVQSRLRALGIDNVVPCLDPGMLEREFSGPEADCIVAYLSRATAVGRDFLDSCARVLTAQGALYLAVDGRPRLHEMPRWLTGASRRGLIRGLRRRFESVDLYRYEHGYRQMGEFEHCPSLTPGWAEFVASPSLSLKRALPRAYGILASHASPVSLFRSVGKTVTDAGHARPGAKMRHAASNHAGAILFMGDPRDGTASVVRIPMSERGVESCRTNGSTLEALERLALADADVLPRALMRGRVGHREFFVESATPGAPLALDVLAARDREGYFGKAVDLLGRLQAPTRRVADRGSLERLVSELFEKAFRNLGEGSLPSSARTIRDFVLGRLADIPSVLSHGDFSTDNLLVDVGGKIRGVIDWEFARMRGLPAVDLFYLLTKIEAASTGGRLGPIFAKRVFTLNLTPSERETCERYCQTVGLPRTTLPMLGILAWVQHIADHLENEIGFRDWPLVRNATEDALLAAEAIARGVGTNQLG